VPLFASLERGEVDCPGGDFFTLRMRVSTIAVLICILTLVSASSVPQSNAAEANPYQPLPSIVDHSMTVRVALVGMSGIDLDQLRWNLEPEIATTIQMSNQVGLGDASYGTKFKMKYEFISVSDESTSALKSYLKSIAETKTVPTYLRNKDTGAYVCWNWWISDSKKYTTLDALKTEEWISYHMSDFGGTPDDGYLIMVADLSDISTLHHYYELTYQDLDKASEEAKYHSKQAIFPIVNWMFSWGGHQRFYFMDLSGGDPKFDYSGICHVPIQDFETRPDWGDIKFKKDTKTVTEYVADYVSETVRNLFVPSYVYAPKFATSYKIMIHVFDETGKVTQDNIDNYLSGPMVRSAFEEVLPYATWDVSISTHKLGDDPELEKVINDSILFSRDITGTFGDKIHQNYYDYRQTYSYLQSHLAQYVQTSGDAVVLPVFEFVFKSGGRFADTWREDIGVPSRWLDGPDRTFSGISLGDLVMIGSPERNLFAFGYGLTQVTIHELGHSIGLMHPHSYGWTEDYVSSAMSYVTYEYEFSQFDKDAVHRAHVDFFLSQVQGAIQASGSVTLHEEAQALLQDAKSTYDAVVNSYSKKDYLKAIKDAQSLSQLLDQAFDAEKRAIDDLVSQTSATTEKSRDLLAQAESLLASAELQKNEGSFPVAYQLLVQASRSVEDAVDAEAYTKLQNELATTRDQLPLYLAAGLGAGIAVAVAVFLVMRRRATQGGPGRESTAKQAQVLSPRRCISCGNEILSYSVYCEHCGARQT